MTLTFFDIEVSGTRSADWFGKNDIYVVFKVVGTSKKVKSKFIKEAGSSCKIPEALSMHVSDADLAAGVEFMAYDYDFGPNPDDLLGSATLTGLADLKAMPDTARQFDAPLTYKGKSKGSATILAKLSVGS
jgi:hypothetical protein